MSDRMAAEIWIGGKVPASLVPALVARDCQPERLPGMERCLLPSNNRRGIAGGMPAE